MQPALIIGGLVVLIIIGLVWARISASRSDRRSMETYGRALGVLGDVSRRTGPSASVRVLPRNETGRGHVRTDSTGHPEPEPRGQSQLFDRASETPPRPRAAGPTGVSRPAAGSGYTAGSSYIAGSRDPNAAAPRRPTTGDPFEGEDAPRRRPTSPGRRPGIASGSSASARPSASIPVPDAELKFEDRAGDWAGAGQRAFREPGEREARRQRRPIEPVDVPADNDPVGAHAAGTHAAGTRRDEPATDVDGVPERQPQGVSADELRRQASVRRLATAGAAGLALLLVVIAAVQLSGSAKPTATSHAKTRPHHVVATSTPTTLATTTTRPSVLTAVSTANGWLTYRVPSKKYSLTFTAQGGDCWVGVETGPASGIFLWTQVASPGVSATYKASGPVAVEFGAIGYISVTVNGLPVRFPANSSTSGLAFGTG